MERDVGRAEVVTVVQEKIHLLEEAQQHVALAMHTLHRLSALGIDFDGTSELGQVSIKLYTQLHMRIEAAQGVVAALLLPENGGENESDRL